LNDHPLRFRYHPAQVVPHADAEPSGAHDWEAIERAGGGERSAAQGNHYDNNYRGIITARGEEASSGAAPVMALTTLIDK